MKRIKYIFLILLGGTLYGTMSSFVKLSYRNGYTAAEISFAQAALAALFLGIFALASNQQGSAKFTRNQIIAALLTGGAIGLTNFLYYLSVSYISASLAIVILMQFTWFSLILEWVLFGNKPTILEVVIILVILIGTLMASGFFSQNKWLFSLKGILLVLLASLTYAVYIVATGRLSKSLRWQSKSTLIMLGSAITILIINGKSIIDHHHFDHIFILWALFFAILGTTIPTALFAASIPNIGAGVSSILMTIELPVAVICASIILQERIDALQIAGIVAMLAAISFMNFYKSRKSI